MENITVKDAKPLIKQVPISVVIPTMNRPEDLALCLSSIADQSVIPKEILIIDDGNLPYHYISSYRNMREWERMAIRYVKKKKPGLSASRNLGAKLAHYDAILYLDDDVILDSTFIEEIWNTWEKFEKIAWKIGGVGGIVKNLRAKSKLERFFNRFFNLEHDFEWDVNDQGYQCWEPEPMEGHAGYLNGGLSMFSKSAVDQYGFRQLSEGRSPGDEVLFCKMLTMNNYDLFITPNAKVYHSVSHAAREGEFKRGYKDAINQKKIFKEIRTRLFIREGSGVNDLERLISFWWNSIGWILRQLFACRFKRMAGMICGYLTRIKERT